MIARSETIDISRQNGLIAYEQNELEKGGSRKIFIISPNGDVPIKTLVLPPTTGRGFFHWTPDESAIAFIDGRNGGANIWKIELDEKEEAKPLTNFISDQSANFDWSSDGKQLLVIRNIRTFNGVIISRSE